MGLTPLWLSSASAYSCFALLWWSRRLVKMHSLEFGETINEVLSWRGHRRCSLPLGQKSLVVVIYLSGCYGIFPSALYTTLPNKHPRMLIYSTCFIRPFSWIVLEYSLNWVDMIIVDVLCMLAKISWIVVIYLSGCYGIFPSMVYSTLIDKHLHINAYLLIHHWFSFENSRS